MTPAAAPWVRKEVIGEATLYLGDSLAIVGQLNRPAAVIGDPPYGIAFAHSGGGAGIGGGVYRTEFAGQGMVGDDKPFDPSPWRGAAPIVCLWGANHFADKLPPSPGWLFWDKRAQSHHSNSFADGELAWTNIDQPLRAFRHHWDGMMKASEKGEARVHPTQKPVALMVWCFEVLGVPARGRVLDPFMGSGTTGVAALRTGRKFVGVEIDPKHFDTACRRIEEAAKQPPLEIVARAAEAKTADMFGDGVTGE